jgi:SAM-dependent methyltransferase
VSVAAATRRLEAGEPLEYLNEVVSAAAAVQAAVRLGVLDRLNAGLGSAQELAAACQLDAQGAQRLLEALAALGLLESHGGRWRPRLPNLSGLAGFVAMWNQLDVVLRTGRPIVRADTTSGAAALYPDVVGNLGTMLSTAAEQAATLLPSATRVLDAGAGAAPWTLAYAARYPSCVVTALDLPAVMPATRRAVVDAGIEKQFEFLPGDLFEVELPRGRYDLAIVGNVCHLFDETANRRLLSRLYEALTPGGMLAIADIAPREGRRSRSVALYELGLHLRTGSGGVHRLKAYFEWLANVGFQLPQIYELVDEPPLMLIIARKPGGG